MIEEDLARDLIAERRRDRLWRNIRWIGWMIVWILFLFLLFYAFGFSFGGKSDKSSGQNYVSLLRLDGVISSDSDFSVEKVLPQLNDAFSDSSSKGVVLLINSPGGSPVQA